MIVDKIWKLTYVVSVRLAPRSAHSQRQATFPDNVCYYSPPVRVCHKRKYSRLIRKSVGDDRPVKRAKIRTLCRENVHQGV